MKPITILLFISTLLFQKTNAQTAEYATVDNYVQKLGSIDSTNLAIITERLTANFPDKKDKARAIFYWIANNISLDLKATKSNDDKKNLPEIVMKNRKATPMGYAMLFQEMSSLANIRCLIVDGYSRNYVDDINNIPDELNHAWNVIQLGHSPETWYYVDVCKAAGFADQKFSTFTTQFTSQYFFADRALFNMDHYPNNKAWLLGSGAKSVKDFYALPVISSAAYQHEIRSLLPLTGFIKTKTKTPVSFKYGIVSDLPIEAVTLIIGEKRQQKTEPMNFDLSGGTLSFQFQFKKEDSYPVIVQANGRDLFMYMVEAVE